MSDDDLKQMGLFEEGFMDKGYVKENWKIYNFKENEQLKDLLKGI